MPLIVNGNIDILNRINGQYTTDITKTVGPIKGIIAPPPPDSTYSPNPLGITYNGSDICTSYEATFKDYATSINNVDIPTGIKKLKVYCLSGGQGGTGAYHIMSQENMYRWVDSFGTSGPNGVNGNSVTSEIIITSGITKYSIVIGAGSNATLPLWDRSGGFGREKGASKGGDTIFKVNNVDTVTAKGRDADGIRQIVTPGPSIPSNYGVGGIGGLAIKTKSELQASYTSNTVPAYCYGQAGTGGFCRVYFFY